MATTWQEAEIGQAAVVPPEEASEIPLELVVLHTTTDSTLQALETAARLARDLTARVRLLVPVVVPYPLPLNLPSVRREFTEQRSRSLAARVGVETRIDIRLCRDPWLMLESTLPSRSLVVLGGGRFWWPSAENRMAGHLRRLGHQVVLAPRQGKG